MPGKIYKLVEQSSPQLDKLNRDRSIVLVNISPLEGHGPHLPLGLDFLDGEFFVKSIAELIVKKMPDHDVVILPGFPLGTQVYKYPGSVWVSTDVFYKIVRGIGESLAKFGYQHIYILSGHGAPKDIAAIDSACVKVSKRYKIKMNNLSGELAVSFLKGDFADRISAKLEKPLTPEELSILKKDFHGGWWETSMMLLLYPELVSEEYKNLPDKEKNEETLRERNGYFGSPSRASAEFARVSLEVITEEALRLINISQMENERGQALVSPLHKYLTLRPYFLRRIISISLIIIKTAVIIYIIYKILR